ncbi:hypothetical protein HQ590_13400, partial [bacterium]|nr:hypothetical protein [bacterium]
AHTQQVELESTATSFSFALELAAADCAADSDTDGLDNCVEAALGTDPGDPDTDGDGMNDGWETRHRDPLVNQDGTVDPDQDSLTDEQESIADTDPDDRDSALRIVSITTSGTDCLIVWASVPGRQYQVSAAPDPEGAFSPLPGALVTAVADTASFTDTNAAAARKVYRVQALP